MHFSWEVLIQQGIPCTWETLYVGRRLDLVTSKDLTSFAVHVLGNSTDDADENIVELAWGSEDADDRVAKLLKSQFDEGTEAWNRELDKIRYGLLLELRTKTKDRREILEGVDLISSHVGHPPDMNHLLYYYPATDGYDPSLHTREENEMRLIRLLDEFMSTCSSKHGGERG